MKMEKQPGVATCPWMKREKRGINVLYIPTITGTSVFVRNWFIFSTSVISTKQTYISTHLLSGGRTVSCLSQIQQTYRNEDVIITVVIVI